MHDRIFDVAKTQRLKNGKTLACNRSGTAQNIVQALRIHIIHIIPTSYCYSATVLHIEMTAQRIYDTFYCYSHCYDTFSMRDSRYSATCHAPFGDIPCAIRRYVMRHSAKHLKYIALILERKTYDKTDGLTNLRYVSNEEHKTEC